MDLVSRSLCAWGELLKLVTWTKHPECSAACNVSRHLGFLVCNTLCQRTETLPSTYHEQEHKTKSGVPLLFSGSAALFSIFFRQPPYLSFTVRFSADLFLIVPNRSLSIAVFPSWLFWLEGTADTGACKFVPVHRWSAESLKSKCGWLEGRAAEFTLQPDLPPHVFHASQPSQFRSSHALSRLNFYLVL